MSAEDIVTRLDGVKPTGAGRWIAKCPAHEDKSPSLAVKSEGDGRALIFGHAGCSALQVLEAIGLTWNALFPPRSSDPNAKRRFAKAGFHSAADALRCLDTEATIVYLAARDTGEGIALSEQDRERVLTAATRIKRAREVCCG